MTTLLDKVFGTYLGIELREDSIVITFLKNSFAGITLLSSSTFPLRQGESVSDEIREYINRHGIHVNDVFVSIPDRWAIIKFIEIPSMKGKGKRALANLMKFEIERHIPFEIDEVSYDFLVMNEKDMVYSVVFVAVQQEKMEFIKDYLDKLSIQPQSITTSSFAVLNSIEMSGAAAGGWQDIIGIVRTSDALGKKGETNISIYIDKTDAIVSVIRDGLCTYLRSFTVRPSESLDVLLGELSRYLSEIQSVLALEQYNMLLLSGNPSHVEELRNQVGNAFVVDVRSVTHVERFSGSLSGVEVNGLSSSIGACFAGLGIGTYNINLLPHKVDYEIKKVAPQATRVFLVLILIIIVGIFSTQAVKQKKFLAQVDETVKKQEPEVKAIEELVEDMNSIKKQSALLYDIRENEIALEVLAELARTLPKDSWVTNFNYNGFEVKDKKKAGGEIIINGYAGSSSALIPLLEDSPYFEKVEFVGPIKKTKDNEQFKLSAKIVRPSSREGGTE